MVYDCDPLTLFVWPMVVLHFSLMLRDFLWTEWEWIASFSPCPGSAADTEEGERVCYLTTCFREAPTHMLRERKPFLLNQMGKEENAFCRVYVGTLWNAFHQHFPSSLSERFWLDTNTGSQHIPTPSSLCKWWRKREMPLGSARVGAFPNL